MKLGVISDTHGFFHPRIPEAFAGVEKIIHAGDLGGKDVYEKLTRIAPVIMVRGNHEPDEIPGSLMDPSTIMLEGRKVLLTHRLITMTWEYFKDALSHFDPLPFFPEVDLVIFGHAHYPVWDKVQEMYFLNPGYAGPDPRESHPTAALLEITHDQVDARIINL
jgi:hypothetical protein